jgi:TRAP-type C4-dicarboxylate transport system permease small subunit
VSLDAAPVTYPDDTAMTAKLRAIDAVIGLGEQIVLVGLLLLIAGVGAAQAIANKAADHSFPWSFDVIRGGTFAIAMIAGAYASQQGSHISMDIMTRRLPARRKLVMRAALAAVTIFATLLLVSVGLDMYQRFKSEGGDHTIPAHWTAAMIPLGGGLIIVHTLIRMVIDVDYLRRGKLPPERAPSAH